MVSISVTHLLIHIVLCIYCKIKLLFSDPSNLVLLDQAVDVRAVEATVCGVDVIPLSMWVLLSIVADMYLNIQICRDTII
jgi:hypothetical protein